MKYRGKCFRMAYFINRICSGLVAISYPAFSSQISPSEVVYMYSFISLMGIIFVKVRLPETKGISLVEIVNLFKIGIKDDTDKTNLDSKDYKL